MSSNLSPNLGTDFLSGTVGAESLSIALIGPDQQKRKAVATAFAENGRTKVSEFDSYPERPEELRWLVEQSFDVIVLDLDSDPDVVLDLVGRVTAGDSATVMVYSERADTKLAVRYMRAGAGEFLLMPLEEGVVAEALDRVAANRHEKPQAAGATSGNLFVFVCAKGGCGATTVACNLAIAMASNSDQKTLLIDLALPIGDAALALGVAAKYSTEDAIRNADRLDSTLLKELVVKHESGLSVLAAPSTIFGIEDCANAIDKLIAVARRNFDHVIVDVGSRIDLMGSDLFRKASTVYLVTLTGVSELRNSNRLISQFFPAGGPNLEVVINRFESRLLGGLKEDDVTKALGRPVRWTAPEDREAAREMQFGEVGAGTTRISVLSAEMAAAITGRAVSQEKKKDSRPKAPTRAAAEEASIGDALPSVKIAPPVPARSTPAINWGTPAPITYGDALSSTQLDATVSTAGTLTYAPAPGSVLPAGMHELCVTFTPVDSERYTETQAVVELEVKKSTPALAWPKPDPIRYGTQIGDEQLNATASIPGDFEYSPAPGELLVAGTHKLSVIFTPTESENFVTVKASVPLVVGQTTPSLTWPKPDPIRYGTQIGDEQLNATASIPGDFEYSPAPGELLAAGTHKLSVIFTPAESENFVTVRASVPLVVGQTTPSLTWPKPDPIRYGTQIGDEQLNATASIPGDFEYSPAPGELLVAGTHKLSVIFTPTESENFVTVKASVPLVVEQATPALTWPKPDPIRYGTRIGDEQLNATASIPGDFEYSPAPGELLAAGTHKLSVKFTPAESENFVTVKASVPLVVEQATPVVTWPSLDSIQYGTQLSASQLCATADVPGEFDYSDAPGTAPAAGAHTLTAKFIPADSENYTPVEASVELLVDKTTPNITWPSPDPIPNGARLSEKQLCATASVPGRFNYSPGAGVVLAAGTHSLSLTFTPLDTENYGEVRAAVPLHVARATPIVEWSNPDPIRYGTKLSAKQLCAMASVPGRFDYTPALGAVLAAGTHTLSATFFPSDGSNYAPVRSTVSLEVAKAIPSIHWPAPQSIRCDTTLGEHQLCATSPQAGTFEYTPGPGRALPTGTHTLSVTFTPTDTANYATTHATVSLKVVEKQAPVAAPTNPEPRVMRAVRPQEIPEAPTPIERRAAQPIKNGAPFKDPQVDAAPLRPAPVNDSRARDEARTTGLRPRSATPLPSDAEKFKPAQAAADSPVEASHDASILPAPARLEKMPKPVQESSFASRPLPAANKTSEVVDPLDWLIVPDANPAHPLRSDRESDETPNAGRKKWIFVGAGAGALLLAGALVIPLLHSRTKSPVKDAAVPVPAASSTESDSPAPDTQLNSGNSKPSPAQVSAQGKPAAAAEAATQTGQAQPPAATPQTSAQAQPSQVQTEMMRNQLNAPTRIPEGAQRSGAANAPPPAGFSGESLGGGSAMGNMFAGKAPVVVAAGPHGPVAVPGDVAMRLLVQKRMPEYPSIAKQARVSGTVELNASISKEGVIENLRVTSGPAMLRQAALDAVRSWRYRPYIVNNQPVEINTTIKVAFSLGQ